jgi:hypothetical protein
MYKTGESYHVREVLNYDSILKCISLSVNEIQDVELLRKVKDILIDRIRDLENKGGK